MKTENFSSCCASTTFANEMVMASLFSSLEHAMTDDIVLTNTWKWQTKLICRFELHEYGSMYEEKFGYVFVTCATGRTSEDILTRFRNTHIVELDIASKEEMKYIELSITELFSKKST
ncbi:hypothetical protein Ahy_B06g083611 [Arachis hypogaea]|uniref:2-oxo-4-hydroxy-4-carboxy-5-ureidoimidazoline decarboxylase n=1 Tax=Arachis hypogaea TaxID=3818 RepID=A0A444YQ86_ARAHY|nr:hypothetical protein Ahy_B06g083611 [Arachis hypogaea]